MDTEELSHTIWVEDLEIGMSRDLPEGISVRALRGAASIEELTEAARGIVPAVVHASRAAAPRRR